MALFTRFFDLNRRVCRWIEGKMPEKFVRSFNALFIDVVADHINKTQKALVVDIGAGRECHFRENISETASPYLIGVDIDETEIRANADLHARAVCDVAQNRVFANKSLDFLVSRSVVEHIHDNAAFVAHAAQMLKPGGKFIHLFPGRYAPFAIVNRLLPDAVARKILYFFHPHFRDPCGFKPYYDRCYHSAMEQMLIENGFEIEVIERRYYQSLYLDFFLPFYLVGLLYDYLAYLSGIKNLASQLLVVARKR